MATAVKAAKAAGEVLKEFTRSGFAVSSKPDTSLVTSADLASEKVILSMLRERFPDDLYIAEESGRSGAVRSAGQFAWVVDPLDGTTNFANRYPFYCVSIGRCEILPDGRLNPVLGVILDPSRDKLFIAATGFGAWMNGHRLAVAAPRSLEQSFLVTGFYYTKGEKLRPEISRFERVAQVCSSIRRDGAAALDLAMVAEGVYDAFWEHGLAVWDIAAGAVLVREAGGVVLNYSSNDPHSYSIEGDGLLAGSPSAALQVHKLL